MNILELKKTKVIISLLFLIMIFNIHLDYVSAGNEIIGYMSNVIYNDCRGYDIDARPLGLTIVGTNQPVQFLKWKGNGYDYSLLNVIQVIIEHEPYSVYVGGGNGQTLLSCNGKNLTANFYTYKWNGERLDPFIYNLNQTVNQVISQIANMNGSYKPQLIQSVGNNNINQNRQNNLFSDNPLILTIEVSFVVSLISLTIFEFAIHFIRKRKSKKEVNISINQSATINQKS